tara:strand:- start:27133 stop:28194 length:1062 start_codon:yes stop_codon:yes gene_type:complete
MNHNHEHAPSCHTEKKREMDYLLWSSFALILSGYFSYWLASESFADIEWLTTFTSSVFELTNTIWFGVLLGIVFVGLLGRVPREFVISILGKSGGLSGILRATGAGVLLDLCSHGILMVAMKLYERGASTGQVMAFLIASPWNSFSLTIILWALVGFWWMMTFLLGSLVIAIISGLIFECLTAKGILPENPNKIDLPTDFKFWPEAKKEWRKAKVDTSTLVAMLKEGFQGSRMVLRWIFFGVVLAGVVRSSVSPEMFQTLFGPTLAGLGLTVLVATILEVCSEGSMPVAADILTKAGAPGNSFAFLMTGVSTDYTEIMSLKGTTKSWKIPLFLPLVTLPQVLLLAWILNTVGI